MAKCFFRRYNIRYCIQSDFRILNRGVYGMNLKLRRVSAALLAGTLLLGAGAVSAAPSLSQPGDEIRKELPQPSAGVEDNTPTPPAETKTAVFTVKNILLDASELKLNKKDVAKILEECVNREVTMAELSEMTNQLTIYCRQNGYPASAAYLPAQDSTDGTITVRVIPGRYGQVILDNQSGLKDDVIIGFVRGLKPGDIIRTGKLETTLYGISDLSGSKAVGVLAPGEDFGTSNITIRVEQGKDTNTVLYAENYGSKSSGRYRYGLQHSILDVGGNGGKLNVGTMISNKDLHNYYLNYEALVGRGGTTLGLGISRMDYTLGGLSAALGANGYANTISLFGSTPIFHMSDRELKFVYGYDYRALTDEMDAYGDAMDMEKHSHNVHVGITGARKGPGIAIDYSAMLTVGTLGIDSDSQYSQIVRKYSGTEGRYTKGEANVTAVQALGHRTDLMVKLGGQLSGSNLDSSEEFYLGGARGVRAYPQGAGSGDVGWQGTMELRYYTNLPGLILSAYLDGGHVKITRDGQGGGRSLKGWGIGIAYSKPNDWFARLDYARRIGGYAGIEGDRDAASSGRTWFILGKTW